MEKLVKESLNSFVRGKDPKNALNLGYAAKIRNLFRRYDIPDENYDIKEDGQVVFYNSLDLHYTNISELPNNLIINNGNLNINDTKITKLPDYLCTDGFLIISNTEISELPNNLIINDNLYLIHTKIIKLPKNLIVKGSIYVDRSQQELINFINQSKFKGKLIIWHK